VHKRDFSHFDPVPDDIAKEVIQQSKAEQEAE